MSDLQAAQWLMGELHDDLPGRVARFQQVNDLCANLGSSGTMIPGEIAYSAWFEARSSFVNGNYVATVMLCQGLAEQMLASHLTVNDPESLFRRALDSQTPTHITLQRDATFAIGVAVDLLASPAFRLGR